VLLPPTRGSNGHPYPCLIWGRSEVAYFGALGDNSGPGMAWRSLGMPQDGRTNSMLQAITLAITCFTCFASDNFTARFIRFILEEFALVGDPAEHPGAPRCLAGASRKVYGDPEYRS
jgi:hypothetical protein